MSPLLPLVLLALACAPAPTAPVARTPLGARDGKADLVALDAPHLARRLSLDLRATLPTTAELDRVEADPAALDRLRAAWLEDPAFEARLVPLLGERWLTLVDDFTLQREELGLDADQEYVLERSIGEEPLRFMARVVAEDRPWTELTTAHTTMANEHLAAFWPVDWPAGATGWQEVSYRDGRPAAGVLVSNGLWWRYRTNPSNANRGRAAALSRLLLCYDYLERPVELGGADQVLDDAGTAEAIKSDPACVTCHVSLDPIAANLFGFYWYESHQLTEMAWYHEEREPMGERALDVTPAWYGTPVHGLADLGRHVAADPRFASCAAETFAEGLWRRPVRTQDAADLAHFTEVLRAADHRIKPMIVAITDGARYRAGGLRAGAPAGVAEVETTGRMLTVDQLGPALEELTGWRWTWEGYDMLRNDDVGYRMLGGGLDGVTVREPGTDPGLTWTLVTRRLAESAADHAVQAELVEGGPHRLFEDIDLDDVPGDDAFTTELSRLHWRLYAERPTEAWLGEATGLWSAVAAEEGPAAAWTTLVAAMLRDPRFLFT